MRIIFHFSLETENTAFNRENYVFGEGLSILLNGLILFSCGPRKTTQKNIYLLGTKPTEQRRRSNDGADSRNGGMLQTIVQASNDGADSRNGGMLRTPPLGGSFT